MAGNSWLGVAQWMTAAEQPPSLKCIAPFEGVSDIYREIICRGGVPYTEFFSWVASTLRGRSQQEDLAAMIEKYPLMNEYWADKRAKIDRIQCPAYVVASYSTCLHTPGTLRGFEDIKHDQKW
jgi:predicted acyl esterase